MSRGRLTHLASQLEALGIDAGGLGDLQEELDVLEKPPGLFARLSRKAKDTAARQWKNVVGEIQESREVMGLLTRRLRDDTPLSKEEADKVRSQLLDMMKVVPAGIIAVSNAALPIPGTGYFTPWILAKTGMLPSRWREAHLLDQLRREHDRLVAEGHACEAQMVQDVMNDLEDEADFRESTASNAALLTLWDANNNGVWDDEEKAAYAEAVADLKATAANSDAVKRWFLLYEGHIFGPVRLSEVSKVDSEHPLLVSWNGKTGWVALSDLLGEGTVEP